MAVNQKDIKCGCPTVIVFYPLEFEGFRKVVGLSAFTVSPSRWIKSTNAIGIILKSGRNEVFINYGVSRRDKLLKQNQIAIQQMRVLEDVGSKNLLKKLWLMSKKHTFIDLFAGIDGFHTTIYNLAVKMIFIN